MRLWKLSHQEKPFILNTYEKSRFGATIANCFQVFKIPSSIHTHTQKKILPLSARRAAEPRVTCTKNSLLTHRVCVPVFIPVFPSGSKAHPLPLQVPHCLSCLPGSWLLLHSTANAPPLSDTLSLLSPEKAILEAGMVTSKSPAVDCRFLVGRAHLTQLGLGKVQTSVFHACYIQECIELGHQAVTYCPTTYIKTKASIHDFLSIVADLRS